MSLIWDEIDYVPQEPLNPGVTEGDGMLPHTLVVSEVHPADLEGEYDPEWGDYMDLQHPDGCPRYLGTGGELEEYACYVQHIVDNVGMRTYFRHQDEPRDDTWDHAEPVAPGTYQIEAWHETYSSYYGGSEYEDGLGFVEA